MRAEWLEYARCTWALRPLLALVKDQTLLWGSGAPAGIVRTGRRLEEKLLAARNAVEVLADGFENAFGCRL